MPKITITREDLLRSKTVTPGWYRMKIMAVEEGIAKTDGSMTISIDLIITQDGPFKDVPVPKTFSEKAPGFARTFVEALIGRKVEEDGGEFELSGAVGREVLGFVKNELFQGRMVNRVEDFQAVK